MPVDCTTRQLVDSFARIMEMGKSEMLRTICPRHNGREILVSRFIGERWQTVVNTSRDYDLEIGRHD